MVGLPRKPIKNEGCEKKGIEWNGERKEMKKGSNRDEISRKQFT
jgi:hypothetical protein